MGAYNFKNNKGTAKNFLLNSYRNFTRQRRLLIMFMSINENIAKPIFSKKFFTPRYQVFRLFLRNKDRLTPVAEYILLYAR